MTRQVCGVTNEKSGTLEFMLHRSLSKDDGRGLGEPVQDESLATISHWLLFDKIEISENIRKTLSLMLEHPIQVIYSNSIDNESEWKKNFKLTFSPLLSIF